MPDLNRRFIKCNGEYHLLTLDDLNYFRTNRKWPDNYQEINWEEEVLENNFITIKDFLGTNLVSERAYTLAILADRLGIPIIKISVSDTKYQTVNAYPRYWLEEMLSNYLK